MTEYNENNVENYEGEYAATDAVNEEFVATIGDSVAAESENEAAEAAPAPVFDYQSRPLVAARRLSFAYASLLVPASSPATVAASRITSRTSCTSS